MDSGTGERYYLTDLMFVIGAGACQVAWWPPVRYVAWAGLLDGVVATALSTGCQQPQQAGPTELERAGAALLQSVAGWTRMPGSAASTSMP